MPRFEDDEEDVWSEEPGDEDEQDGDEEEVDLEEMIEASEEYIETGEARRAIRLWRRSIDRFADESRAHYNQALACRAYLEEQLGDEPLAGEPDLQAVFEQGINALDEALTIEPKHVPSWNLLGRLHLINENDGAAAEAFEKSLDLDDSQDDIDELLSQIRSRLKEE